MKTSQTTLITFPNTHTLKSTHKFTAQNLKTTNRALPLKQETNYQLKSIFQPQRNPLVFF